MGWTRAGRDFSGWKENPQQNFQGKVFRGRFSGECFEIPKVSKGGKEWVKDG
jgi:hypothetical protein